jgi:hypothetical protein
MNEGRKEGRKEERKEGRKDDNLLNAYNYLKQIACLSLLGNKRVSKSQTHNCRIKQVAV